MTILDTALLVIRLVVGTGIAAHGAQKLFGWFGGYGIKGTGGFFDSIGFRPGTFFATAAGFGEFGGGLLIALGLFGPTGATLVTATMLVAIFAVHIGNGFFGTNNGYELPLMYISAAMALAFAGPGAFALDHAFGLTSLDTPFAAGLGLIVAILGAGLNLAVRRTELKTENVTLSEGA